MNNDILTMTKEDFKNLPLTESWDNQGYEFDSIVIIPTGKKHDSNFMCMDFVGCNKGKALMKLSGVSDVLHIDGIGGYGEHMGSISEKILAKGWKIDCLPCGYLRLFCHYKIKAGCMKSDFEIYGIDK